MYDKRYSGYLLLAVSIRKENVIKWENQKKENPIQ